MSKAIFESPCDRIHDLLSSGKKVYTVARFPQGLWSIVLQALDYPKSVSIEFLVKSTENPPLTPELQIEILQGQSFGGICKIVE